MDRESLGDPSMCKYAVIIVITAYEPDALIEWTVRRTARVAGRAH